MSTSLLNVLRNAIDHIDVHTMRTARLIVRLIPGQCPFERDIVIMHHKIAHIPPMCKINPVYDQLAYLRFRALSFLADHDEHQPC
ncbi:hypothetical protein BH10CYA1_BH10CYA1_53690 [soil metagenome]